MEIINPDPEASRILKVAILDMYNNVPNQGMRCIKQIISEQDGFTEDHFLLDEVFDVRGSGNLPQADDYDIYVSTGGPGSPFDGEGQAWEAQYFQLLDQLWAHNQNLNGHKKYVFFICHSFQMLCRYFEFAHVTKRRSTSFGIFPIHKTIEGLGEPFYHQLPDPYYAVDSRDWQVTQPNFNKMSEVGAKILSLEKIRPHVDLERAVMSVRISNEFFGTQFHPEADATGMSMYFQQEDKRRAVIDNHGEQKYQEMIDHLNDPDKIALTYNTVLPNFLREAVGQLRGVCAS